jgi:CDGSH-type Zn-finger protein
MINSGFLGYIKVWLIIILGKHYIFVAFLLIMSKAEKRNEAITVELETGKKYSFCTCGHSARLPFCDNTHREINSEEGTCYKSIKICPREDVILEISSSNWVRKEK